MLFSSLLSPSSPSRLEYRQELKYILFGIHKAWFGLDGSSLAKLWSKAIHVSLCAWNLGSLFLAQTTQVYNE